MLAIYNPYVPPLKVNPFILRIPVTPPLSSRLFAEVELTVNPETRLFIPILFAKLQFDMVKLVVNVAKSYFDYLLSKTVLDDYFKFILSPLITKSTSSSVPDYYSTLALISNALNISIEIWKIEENILIREIVFNPRNRRNYLSHKYKNTWSARNKW
ncbi:MAG: hypothetical protein WCG28_01145 [bacterium]